MTGGESTDMVWRTDGLREGQWTGEYLEPTLLFGVFCEKVKLTRGVCVWCTPYPRGVCLYRWRVDFVCNAKVSHRVSPHTCPTGLLYRCPVLLASMVCSEIPMCLTMFSSHTSTCLLSRSACSAAASLPVWARPSTRARSSPAPRSPSSASAPSASPSSRCALLKNVP